MTTLFPRSRHPERGDDTLSKIETFGARCRHQQRNQTTKPKSSAGTCAETQIERRDLRRDSIPLLLLSSREALFERAWLVGVLFVELSNRF